LMVMGKVILEQEKFYTFVKHVKREINESQSKHLKNNGSSK
jgi:hypothetical protein